MINFSYDPVNHIYRIDNKIVPSVSGVLAINPVNRHLNEYFHQGKKYAGLVMAQDFGTDVHDVMDKMINGEEYVIENTARGQTIGKMYTFAKKSMENFLCLGKEIPLGSHFGFGGTPDIWGMGKRKTVIDYKSNQKTNTEFKQQCVPRYEAQLGGYAILLLERDFDAEIGIIMHLYGQKNYEVDIEKAKQKFMKLLEIKQGKTMYDVPMKDVLILWNAGMYIDEISEIVPLDRSQIREVIESSNVYSSSVF